MSPSPIHHHQTGTVTTKTISQSFSSSSPKSIYTTPNPFEARFGYHRGVRKGPFIFVSGTTALIEISDASSSSPSSDQPEDDSESDGKEQAGESESKSQSKVHYPTDARKQAQVAMERCMDAVEKLGGKRGNVVRVRMFVSRHEDCLDVGEAFKNCFAEAGAVATMVVVKDGFVDPDILVEVEVDAVTDV